MIRSEITFLKEVHASTLTFWKTFKLPWCKAWIDSQPAGRMLAAKTIQEEFNELTAAVTDIDKLDAYCDLMYVTAGAMHALGYDHTYLHPDQIIPPIGFAGPVAETIKLIQEPGIVCHRRLQQCIPDALYGILDRGEYHFPNFRRAFRAVHAANMSKLWKHKPEDMENRLAEPTGDGRWLVKNATTGKVLKSPEFKHPDLVKYL